MYALSKAQAGDICTIKWMFGLPEAVDFLRQHHVEEGETIQVIRKLRDSLGCRMSGWRLEKKSRTAYRFKKREGRAFVALLSFLCKKCLSSDKTTGHTRHQMADCTKTEPEI